MLYLYDYMPLEAVLIAQDLQGCTESFIKSKNSFSVRLLKFLKSKGF